VRSSGLDWVENDLTSLEKVVRRVGGRGERGKATILILALDCLWLVGWFGQPQRQKTQQLEDKPRTNVVDGQCLFVNGLDGDPFCEHF
jgi:hypothetical protein